VIYVPAAELQQAALAPADFKVKDLPDAGAEPTTRALRAVAPEPLLAMARPPGLALSPPTPELDGEQPLVADDPAALAGIHMPSPSIAPFVLGLGFCLVFLGLITNVIILVVGLLWMLAGAIVWIRIGLLEAAAAHGHTEERHSA
jgi:hypothetical protein